MTGLTYFEIAQGQAFERCAFGAAAAAVERSQKRLSEQRNSRIKQAAAKLVVLDALRRVAARRFISRAAFVACREAKATGASRDDADAAAAVAAAACNLRFRPLPCRPRVVCRDAGKDAREALIASAAAKREIVKRLQAELAPLEAGVDDARTAVGRRRHELVRFEIDAKVLKSEAQRRVNALRKAIRSLSLECRVDPPRIRHLAAAALQRSLSTALSLRREVRRRRKAAHASDEFERRKFARLRRSFSNVSRPNSQCEGWLPDAAVQAVVAARVKRRTTTVTTLQEAVRKRRLKKLAKRQRRVSTACREDRRLVERLARLRGTMHRAFARQQRARKPYWVEPPPIQWAVPPATPKTPSISWAAPLAMPRTPASRPGTGRSATPNSRPGTRGSDKAPLQGWEGLFHEPRSARSVSFAAAETPRATPNSRPGTGRSATPGSRPGTRGSDKAPLQGWEGLFHEPRSAKSVSFAAAATPRDTPKRKSRPRSVRFSLPDTPEAVVRPGGASPALFDAAPTPKSVRFAGDAFARARTPLAPLRLDSRVGSAASETWASLRGMTPLRATQRSATPLFGSG